MVTGLESPIIMIIMPQFENINNQPELLICAPKFCTIAAVIRSGNWELRPVGNLQKLRYDDEYARNENI